MMDGDGTKVLDFYGLISKLREYWAENTTRGMAVNHGAFSVTLNGRDANGRKACLYGEDHRFSQCPYLIRQKRSPGWLPDDDIEKKVHERLRKSESLRLLVEDLQRYAAEHPQKGEVQGTLPDLI
jgi:hypothetical protein